MKRLVFVAVLSTALSCAGKDPCVEMEEAAAEGAGLPCSSGGDCPSVPCACADGSTVNLSSCFNGACAGIEACEEACGGELLAECSTTGGGGGGGGGTCCVYECESGGIVATGSTSSATDQASCNAAADAFCDTLPRTCVTLLAEQCSSNTCDCQDAEDNGGTCPAP